MNEWVLIEWVYGNDGQYKMKQYGFKNYDVAFERMKQLNGKGATIVALVKESEKRKNAHSRKVSGTAFAA